MIPAVAKTWHSNLAITRVFSTYHSQNGWAAFSGLGYRKIEPGSADGVTNMLLLFAEALASGKRVNIYADGQKVYRAVMR